MNITSIARLDAAQRRQILSRLSDDQADELCKDWSFLGRANQQPPPGNWRGWLLLAGRGFGKTRTGAEWVRAQVKAGHKSIGIIGATIADVRDVLIKGKGGLLSVCWHRDVDCRGNLMGIPAYEPSKRHRLTWANGAVCMGYSAEEPERLRGPQHEKLWLDDVAAWDDPYPTYDMAMFGLRLGANPQLMISTTPKPIPLVRDMIRWTEGESPTWVKTTGSTYENRANLADAFIETIVKRYEGTRLGRQELNAELVDEVEGALWTRAMVEAARVDKAPDLRRIVVAIDPAVTVNKLSNLTGIVVAGLGVDGKGYVLRDGSGKFSPGEWANKAIALYDEFKADRIVAEGNQGGEMVRHTIQSARGNIPIKVEHAKRGKQARAEPVAALYEQNRVKHVGAFPELDDQLCTWEPLTGQESPDRLDAMVWALTSLMLDQVPDVPVVVPYVHYQPSSLPY